MSTSKTAGLKQLESPRNYPGVCAHCLTQGFSGSSAKVTGLMVDAAKHDWVKSRPLRMLGLESTQVPWVGGFPETQGLWDALTGASLHKLK